MLSLESQLAKTVQAMKPSTLRKYSQRTDGKKLPIENLVNVAESLLGQDGELRESISRNNGRQRDAEDSHESTMADNDRVLFEGMEACRSTAKGLAQLVEVNGNFVSKAEGVDQLSESERQDAEFCRLIGMSESDAIKVAKSKAVRG